MNIELDDFGLEWDHGGWIPVSEKSPKSAGTYIVTAMDGGTAVVAFMKWQNRYKRWDKTGRRAYWKVVAWMPLPDPYREANE